MIYLKGTNFRGDKILKILGSWLSAKLNPCEIFQNQVTAKLKFVNYLKFYCNASCSFPTDYQPRALRGCKSDNKGRDTDSRVQLYSCYCF